MGLWISGLGVCAPGLEQALRARSDGRGPHKGSRGAPLFSQVARSCRRTLSSALRPTLLTRFCMMRTEEKATVERMAAVCKQ